MQEENQLKKNILIVENDELNIDVISKFLKNDYLISAVKTAAKAEEALQEMQFDLILLDINLGDGVGGLGLLERLKASGTLHEVPVLAITAFGANYQKSDILAAGSDEFLTKPFGKKELLAAIQNVLLHHPKVKTEAARR